MLGNMNLKKATDFDLFSKTDEKTTKNEVISIDGQNLKHYENHHFKLYTGIKFDEMTESIRQYGIIQPIIVRPIQGNDFDYEILAGHNRLECGKVAGLSDFPCIVRENLSDDEAKFYVIRTNIDQRSLADLSHSERAVIIHEDYEENKKQGKRNDLINDISNILGTFEEKNEPKGDEQGKRTIETIGEKFDMSKDMIARYIRINSLIQPFLDVLDNEEISLSTGAMISYLKMEEQQEVYDYTNENNLKILYKHAEQLKFLSQSRKFKTGKIEELFNGKKPIKPSKPKTTVLLKRKSLENYFSQDESEESIESIIIEALSFYFEHKNEPKTEHKNAENTGDDENVQDNFDLELDLEQKREE